MVISYYNFSFFGYFLVVVTLVAAIAFTVVVVVVVVVVISFTATVDVDDDDKAVFVVYVDNILIFFPCDFRYFFLRNANILLSI